MTNKFKFKTNYLHNLQLKRMVKTVNHYVYGQNSTKDISEFNSFIILARTLI
jgi:hypothetical protein